MFMYFSSKRIFLETMFVKLVCKITQKVSFWSSYNIIHTETLLEENIFLDHKSLIFLFKIRTFLFKA